MEHRVLFLRRGSLLKILNDRCIQNPRVIPSGKQDDQGKANCDKEVEPYQPGHDLRAIGDSKVEKSGAEESLGSELMWIKSPSGESVVSVPQ